MFPISLAVVSWPATTSSTTLLATCSGVSFHVLPSSSTTSDCRSNVMMSSPGDFARSFTTSIICIARSRDALITSSDSTGGPSVTDMASMRDDRSWMLTRASAGMPSISQMTAMGSTNEKSLTMSICSRSRASASSSRQTARTVGSCAATAIGVKTRDTRRRCQVCSGWSLLMRMSLPTSRPSMVIP